MLVWKRLLGWAEAGLHYNTQLPSLLVENAEIKVPFATVEETIVRRFSPQVCFLYSLLFILIVIYGSRKWRFTDSQ